ncbi:MAG: phage BR0599 family protein [Burkholderiales bacterium]|nr:phage BR0599 family protein [Burkholderiales bacterium]
MTYATVETSAALGQPVELYEFRRGVTAWRYTSAQTDQTLGTDIYTALPLQRGGIKLNSQMSQQRLELTLSRDVPLAAEFVATPPSDVMLLTVRRKHATDADVVIVWQGRVLAAQWADQATMLLHCEPIYTSLKRPGLRRLYQRGCPHVLYGAACGVSTAGRSLTANCSLVSGINITVPGASAQANGWWAGGSATWSVNGANVGRMIGAHAGDVLTLVGAPFGLTVGTAVTLLPGCDHTLTTCDAKFANSANYGGFPFIPAKNPLGGQIIY